MKNTETIDYPNEAFDQALYCFSVVTLSFSKELEKLDVNDYLPRYNRIKISINYKNNYAYPILFLKVFRKGSEIGEDNFYSFPMHTGNLLVGFKYEIDFLHFDAFNLSFDNIEVSIISADDYSKRKLNNNAANRAKKETIKIDMQA